MMTAAFPPIRRWLHRRLERRARAFFDDAFYRETYADAAAPDFDRFRHFMDHGWREGRNPSASIDTLFYRDRHLGGAEENPLLHLASEGAASRIETTFDAEDREFERCRRALCRPYFCEAFYRQGSGYGGEDALGHHLAQEWRTAAAPSPIFDAAEHVQQHSFLEKQSISPLYHFASQRRSRGDALPLTLDPFAETTPGTLVEQFTSPAYRLAPPRLVEFQPIPGPLRRDLDAIWERGETGGGAVTATNFGDVFVVGNGLVFTQDGVFIGATRHGHTDAAVREGALHLATALARDGCDTIEHGILAKTEGARNYGHFLLEMLPCAWFARRRLGCRHPAIIAGGSPIEPIAREALRTIGFEREDVVTCGDRPLHVRDLVVVGGLAQHPLHISPLVLECFDEIAGGIDAAPIGKLYAARGNGAVRDFADEAAVSHRLAEAGFRRETTGSLPFATQVALFKGARHVLGVSGAALTNLLFCRSGTRVSLISPSSASEVLFWTIAELRGLDYEEFRCREVGPQRGSLPWNRDIDLTAAELSTVLSRAEN